MAENKNFKSKENSTHDIINNDKSGIHKTTVNSTFESTIQNELIEKRRKSYIETNNLKQDYKKPEYKDQEYKQPEYKQQEYRQQEYNDYSKKNGGVPTAKAVSIPAKNKRTYKSYKYNQEQNYNGNKPLKVNENSTHDIINNDKSGINKTTVNPTFESIIKDDLIKNKTYYTHDINEGKSKVEHYMKYTPEKRGIEKIDVESSNNNPIYGTVEKQIGVNTTLKGAAKGALIHGNNKNIINPDKAGMSSTFIKNDPKNILNGSVNISNTEFLSSKANSRRKVSNKIASVLSRELENKLGQAGTDGSLESKTQALGGKYGFKAGKYALSGTSSLIVGGSSYYKYSKALKKDVEEGLLTGKGAAAKLFGKGKSSIKGSSNSIGKILLNEAGRGIEDFEGSDDLGIQAIVKPKNVIRDTKRALKTAKVVKNTTKKGVQGSVRVSQRIVQKTTQAARYTYGVAKTALTNPLIAKSAMSLMFVVVIIAFLLTISSSIASIVPSISLKSDDVELTKTYEHLTKLDAELTVDIRGVQTSWINQNIDKFNYFVNGYETSAENIEIFTNIDRIILYLDTKYDDYAFDKLMYGLFGGNNIKEEITNIHNSLYSYSTNKWTEEIEHTSTVYDDLTGEESEFTWKETIINMDINVAIKSFDEYLFDNIDTLLTEEDQERMSVLEEVGLYTSKISLGSPFEEDYFVSSRWGWRIHPINSGLHKHTGIDIPKPSGTNIINILSGYVEKTGNDPQGLGKYVVVKSQDNKRKVVYAHMSSISVNENDIVTQETAIGKVGSTGSSTGPHLHLEYYIDGNYITNPQFFVKGAYSGAGGVGGVGSENIVQAALSQVGQVGGEPYWRWYGFHSRVEWCATFVSWAANQSGYLQDGTIPKFAGVQMGGVNWFKGKGQWQNRGYVPRSGDIIFFDWGGDGWSDHVGIVVATDGQTVQAVEGNSSNSVARRTYHINSSSIMGYGIPNY